MSACCVKLVCSDFAFPRPHLPPPSPSGEPFSGSLPPVSSLFTALCLMCSSIWQQSIIKLSYSLALKSYTSGYGILCILYYTICDQYSAQVSMTYTYSKAVRIFFLLLFFFYYFLLFLLFPLWPATVLNTKRGDTPNWRGGVKNRK